MSKISELSDGGALQSTDYLIAVRSGGNVKVQLSELPSGIGAGGNIVFGDNEKAIFGAGSDLEIYHSGTHSIINETGTGELKIQATNLRLQSASGGENYLTADLNGAVRVYYDDAQKFQTTATGIDVTGTVTADELDVSTLSGDATIYLQNVASARGMKITKNYDDFSAKFFYSLHPTTEAGSLAFKGAQDSTQLLINSNGDISFYEDTGTTPKFFWDASAEALAVGGTSTFTSKIVASAANGTAYSSNSQLRISGGGVN
jgi:hypothetical protein